LGEVGLGEVGLVRDGFLVSFAHESARQDPGDDEQGEHGEDRRQYPVVPHERIH